ncbi:DUF2712 domain-containing protein [Bacillus mycoides]|uniref:DUF2712 domain-containing protein n=1 Tax=Bacillus mycoides TaxID=1405 RepID=UPI0008646654|nr:DUF2712 domain-containing protein [Bacillus mycoides]OHX31079.1 hypothetical protein BWGOE5_29840 [Bacillus mycoides]SCM90502.1 Uncharacterized protein BWAI21_06023 [Bacillus mycoides]
MKKFFKKFVLAGALLGFVATNVNVDFASADSSDTRYYLEWPKGGMGTAFTKPRNKDNYTSAYIKAEYIGNGHQLYAWVADGNGGDQSGGHYYYVSAGEARKLANLVKERGQSQARIAANLKGYSFQSIASGGVWSPDSV